MLNRPRPRKIVTVVRSDDPKPEVSLNKEPDVPIAEVHEAPVKEEQPPPQNPPARKPVVATARKAFVPPPPSFSEVRSPNSSKGTSPVSSPKKNSFELPRPSDDLNKVSVSFTEDKPQLTSPPAPTPLSPKSSGEKILDAADKAADFLGDALRVSVQYFYYANFCREHLKSYLSPRQHLNQSSFPHRKTNL